MAGRHLAHFQTNFVRMLWKLSSACNAERPTAEHARPARYLMPEPPEVAQAPPREALYTHVPLGVQRRARRDTAEAAQ